MKNELKNYLSFGGGVNSVALYLLMEKLGMDFEAVFVNHGGDWPETYEYVDYFISTGRPITILTPNVNTVEKVRFKSIVDYCKHRVVTPSRISRWCTDRFKVKPMYDHVDTPCFMHLGIDFGEIKRAILNSRDGVENRFLLIEHEINRDRCKQIISEHGLIIPRKSGCYICPFQGRIEYRELRRKHPELFCEVKKLEEAQNKRVTRDGRPWKPFYLAGKPLGQIVSISEEKQMALPGMEEVEYPPCQCGL